MTLPHATIGFGEAMHRQGRPCPACRASVPLAVTATSTSTFYLGWICALCLAADAEDGLLDVISLHPTREAAELDLLHEEYRTASGNAQTRRAVASWLHGRIS